jgi:tripartite ATP-independent transporter DctM subunit
MASTPSRAGQLRAPSTPEGTNMLFVGLIFLVLILFIFAGYPVFMASIITSVAAIIVMDVPFSVAIIKIFGGIDSFTLMAIPFFIVAGNVMMESEITDRIVGFANSIVGQFRGGLGYVNILSSMIFAGIQGSGAADASAIGSILIPSMVKQGYDTDYAVAVTAAGATIGPIIPPSIAMLMYAYYTELSVGQLFIGGFIPGVMIGLGLMTVHFLLYRLRKYTIPTSRFSFRKLLVTLRGSIGALIMPFIIIFGIVGGVFTPTESGIAAILYGLFYGFFISKKLSLGKIPKILLDSATTTAVVMISLAMAGVLGNVLVRLDFQNVIIQLVTQSIANKYLASLLIMLILLILGCFVDVPVLIAMFSSALMAAGMAMGFDPIHFGVFMVITMQIGAITPPVGAFLFIACSIAKIPLEKSIKVMWPFTGVIIVVTIMVLFIPDMSLALNRLLFPVR